ncbi:MAG TPA: LuxR C-terminal-related transcriptional regulator [Dinghuibacter sp.]|uniref:LuxR C-terminal-related transcriptional regulator n=1 Tax=Dinghuibacter sp. TaxID=2024697 RepID=UPI002CA7A8FC|nr:LuxR C-terminal-related transcriptional regulator [Dinghuibacter sp.]HTJ12035.1 LuxR C-terminal-related transcriptional regulator [Dinghuibacter sp.]
MTLTPLDIAREIWKTNSPKQVFSSEEQTRLALEVSSRLLNFFQPGDFYVYVFNVSTADLEHVSPGMEKVLGHSPGGMTIADLFNLIHPDDQPFFVNYEHEWGKFMRGLDTERLFKYKVRMDLRMRKSDGSYKRILHQAMVFDVNEDGGILRSFGVHTDIDYLKIDGKPSMSIIGFDGEPSYTNVKTTEELIPVKETLSKREKEILQLITEGLLNKEIAARLNISKETVDKHRKNMLEKTGCKTSTELVSKALRNGWL